MSFFWTQFNSSVSFLCHRPGCSSTGCASWGRRWGRENSSAVRSGTVGSHGCNCQACQRRGGSGRTWSCLMKGVCLEGRVCRICVMPFHIQKHPLLLWRVADGRMDQSGSWDHPSLCLFWPHGRQWWSQQEMPEGKASPSVIHAWPGTETLVFSQEMTCGAAPTTAPSSSPWKAALAWIKNNPHSRWPPLVLF